jgi:hypothetical protein
VRPDRSVGRYADPAPRATVPECLPASAPAGCSYPNSIRRVLVPVWAATALSLTLRPWAEAQRHHDQANPAPRFRHQAVLRTTA